MKALRILCLVFNLLRLVTNAADTLPEVIPAELSSCPMVFIRKDGHVAPLAPLYEGPYKVLSRSLKPFQLQVGKRVEVVLVQRLKPAFTKEDDGSSRTTTLRQTPTPTSSSPS